MKKILSSILLLTFFFSNLAYAQQGSSNNQYNYTWSSGNTQQVVTPLATGNYSVGVTDVPSKQEIERCHNQVCFNSKVAQIESGELKLDQAVAVVVDILLLDVDQTENNTTDKMSALGTLDVIFSNNLLTTAQEEKLIIKRLVSAIGFSNSNTSSSSESWAAVALGILANYYPATSHPQPLPINGNKTTPKVYFTEYNPRDSKYRTYIEALFKRYLLDSEAKLETRLSMAEAVGFIKNTSGTISGYIDQLGKTIPELEYDESPNSSVIFSLCRALAYQAKVYKDGNAKYALERYYTGIRSKDEYYNYHPLMINVYSAIAAGSYGIQSAYQPLGVFALWGDVDNIFQTGGIKAVPYDMRKMAYAVLPEFEKYKIKTENPSAIEKAYEEVDGQEVLVERPVYTDAEYWATSIASGINDAAWFLVSLALWEVAGAAYMSWAVSSEFAIANSVFAECVGYVVAASRGGKMGVAAYESFLVMNTAKYAITFAETPIGIMFSKIGKGIKTFFVKFAPQITALKNGVVVTSTVLNMNVAVATTARTLPNITNKVTTSYVLNTVEKETLAVANTIVRSSTTSSTIVESELMSLLQKKGMDVVNAGKYLGAIKSASSVNLAPFMGVSAGGSFIQTTFNVFYSGGENILVAKSDIPGDMTFTRVFKFKDGQVKAYSGIGGGAEPPISISEIDARELEELMNSYNLYCTDFVPGK